MDTPTLELHEDKLVVSVLGYRVGFGYQALLLSYVRDGELNHGIGYAIQIILPSGGSLFGYSLWGPSFFRDSMRSLWPDALKGGLLLPKDEILYVNDEQAWNNNVFKPLFHDWDIAHFARR